MGNQQYAVSVKTDIMMKCLIPLSGIPLKTANNAALNPSGGVAHVKKYAPENCLSEPAADYPWLIVDF
jgi:hypothetical protein